MDAFFARMKGNARMLDRSKAIEPGIRITFEDPADFLEVLTPARVRLLREISAKPVALNALARTLDRDTSAVRKDVGVLERKCLVKTRKVANPGHGTRTLVERAAASIELITTV